MNYEKYLFRAAKVQRESALAQSAGLSLVYIIILGFYAYSFYFGGFCRWTDDDWFINPTTDKKYTGGEVMGIMFMIMFGIMQMSAMGTDMKAITEAKIGGKLAYDVIDNVPSVQPGKGQPFQGSCNGQIEFKNVEFTYPTRPELKVIKGLTCSFDAGKTTAIVGPSGSGKSTII